MTVGLGSLRLAFLYFIPGLCRKMITEDDSERLCMCIKVLAEQCPLGQDIFLQRCRKALDLMLEAKMLDDRERELSAELKKSVSAGV